MPNQTAARSRFEQLTTSPRASRPRSASALRRGDVLARDLYVGDTLAALIGSAVSVAVFGLFSAHALAFVFANALIWPLTAFIIGLYRSDQLASWASSVSEVPRGMVALLLVSWPLFAVGYVLSLHPTVALIFVTIIVSVLLAALSRTLVRARLHRLDILRQRTLILGSGVVAGQVAGKLKNNKQFGLVPVGIIDDEVHDIGTPDLPLLGRFRDLGKVIEERDIDRVIIAFSRTSHEGLLESIRACRDAGVAIDVVPRLFEFLDGVRALDQVGGLPLLSIGVPNLTWTSLAAKRILDLLVSGTMLVLLSPVLLAIAIAVKIDSRGPVFFRQPRTGRRNKSFRLIKFRSMYIDAEDRKKEMEKLNESSDGVMFKIRDDPRVTRVGRFIRRYSLDELPQLFNVLLGEMSLVGPRPLIFPETAALDEKWHFRRLELRPGITGPWQVYGRSQSPFQEMIRFDYQYVAGWSLARDIEILMATIPAVLSGRGAY
jgi:exopolysaccharide biosynthesis polyprenyl glycosylphosphotransferase